MKKILFATLTIIAATAYANCTTQTFIDSNTMKVCTTCCEGGSCTTNCL